MEWARAKMTLQLRVGVVRGMTAGGVHSTYVLAKQNRIGLSPPLRSNFYHNYLNRS
jgi:hypothetical protein